MKDKIKIKTSERKGFTLLLSLLVISIILSVGFGVFDIMTKELKISSIGRESQIAFYAADAGVECAYFWDIKHPDLDQSAFDLNNNSIDSVKCGDGVVVNNENTEGNDFSFSMGDKCAIVSVNKEVNGKTTITTIQSRGYNYPCNSNSKHKVERAIKVISTKIEAE